MQGKLFGIYFDALYNKGKRKLTSDLVAEWKHTAKRGTTCPVTLASKLIILCVCI